MKKILLSVTLTLVGLLIIVYVGVEFFLGSVVKAGVNNLGPRLTQTKVELAGAKISPLSGSGTLTGLAVGNPKGWSNQNAFFLGKVHLEIEPMSLFHDPVVINDMVIEQPEFLYETRIVSSNIGDLLKNIEAATGGGTEPAKKNGKPRKFEVKHFRLENGKVSLGFGPAAIPLPMPTIELKDLGTTEGGLTSNQLAFEIMQHVAENIVTATTQAAGTLNGTMGAAASDAAKKAADSLKKFFGGGKK